MSKLIEQRLQELETEIIEIKTGIEYATNEYIDDKRVYRKRVDCGAAPNSALKEVETGLRNVTYIKIDGIAQISDGGLPINFTRPQQSTDNSSVGVFISYNKIMLETKIDRSALHIFVDIYYTKN
ncbi:MAG: hypothetical protein HFJ52_03995 [Clostridia bacterium]|nr:hypothetical protein [Clostridia bacterium]